MTLTITPPPKAVDLDNLTLTAGQQNALEAFTSFLLDPDQHVFVLSGGSGTGKTTLIRVLVSRLSSLMNMLSLTDPDSPAYDLQLTATTNKAAEAFSHLTGREVMTIHSYLGLRVQTDHRTRETFLVPANKTDIKRFKLIFIDEASFLDAHTLDLIFQQTTECKIVLMGDKDQLLQVNSPDAPAFKGDYPMAELTEVVRQAAGNPIIKLATEFRAIVNGAPWQLSPVDGHYIQMLDRADFEAQIVAEFTRDDWRFHDSKILAWTNQRVVDFNHAVRDCVAGNTEFAVGDYAICNSYVPGNRDGSNNKGLTTDEMVQITGISDEIVEYGVKGRIYTINGKIQVFGPNSLSDWKTAYRRLKAAEQFNVLNTIDNTWIDLRAAYACTVNKSQGSTYDRVYIDLDDIARCRDRNQVARMLYVGISRARHQVFLTGDV